jgi:hypothetical protein
VLPFCCLLNWPPDTEVVLCNNIVTKLIIKSLVMKCLIFNPFYHHLFVVRFALLNHRRPYFILNTALPELVNSYVPILREFYYVDRKHAATAFYPEPCSIFAALQHTLAVQEMLVTLDFSPELSCSFWYTSRLIYPCCLTFL